MSIRAIIKRRVVLFAMLFISIAFFIALNGCGKMVGQAKDKSDIVAYVNKEPIFSHEVKRDIALRAKIDPSFSVTPETTREILDVIIDRKLIVQSAIERGLAREESFVNTIRTFWEQVLIRDFIDYKKKELQDYIFATDDEIRRYYDNMSYKVTFRVLRSRDEKYIDMAYSKYLKDKDSSAWETVGPIGYEELLSSVLLDAFRMAPGEAGKFKDDSNYYVIEVLEKTMVETPPLEELKAGIEKRVSAMKERRLFEDWLKEKRAKSKVRIMNPSADL